MEKNGVHFSRVHDQSSLEAALEFLDRPAFRGSASRNGLESFHREHLKRLSEHIRLGECAAILATLGDANGELVGVLVFSSPQENTLSVDSLAVSRQRQGQGVATGMIDLLEERAQKLNAEKITAAIPQQVHDLQSLAAKNGGRFTRATQQQTGAETTILLHYEKVAKNKNVV